VASACTRERGEIRIGKFDGLTKRTRPMLSASSVIKPSAELLNTITFTGSL
jgi:hypothetical protein